MLSDEVIFSILNMYSIHLLFLILENNKLREKEIKFYNSINLQLTIKFSFLKQINQIIFLTPAQTL